MESTATAQAPSVDQASFAFVQDLAQDLNRDAIDLPSFPDVALRVKKVLEDERSTADKIARVISSEPGLAARLLKMANSAAVNRSGHEVRDVKTAVNRLGHDQIRTSATSFAMKSMMDSRTVDQLKPFLTQLWNHSVHVAAIAYALGRRAKTVNADEAMFVGLVHDIGKLYILTKMEDHPELFGDPAKLVHIMNDWHTPIGKSILENWQFPDHVLEAVDLHEVDDRASYTEPDLTDVIIVANLFSNTIASSDEEIVDFSQVESCVRMGIDEQKFHEVMAESKNEIEEMMSALKG